MTCWALAAPGAGCWPVGAPLPGLPRAGPSALPGRRTRARPSGPASPRCRGDGGAAGALSRGAHPRGRLGTRVASLVGLAEVSGAVPAGAHGRRGRQDRRMDAMRRGRTGRRSPARGGLRRRGRPASRAQAVLRSAFTLAIRGPSMSTTVQTKPCAVYRDARLRHRVERVEQEAGERLVLRGLFQRQTSLEAKIVDRCRPVDEICASGRRDR